MTQAIRRSPRATMKRAIPPPQVTQILPNDIPLADTCLRYGCLWGSYPTAGSLNAVYRETVSDYPYVATGALMVSPHLIGHRSIESPILGPDQWIFAPSAVALMKALLRWDEMALSFTPDDMSESRDWLEIERADFIRQGTWTTEKQEVFASEICHVSWIFKSTRPDTNDYCEWLKDVTPCDNASPLVTNDNGPLPVDIIDNVLTHIYDSDPWMDFGVVVFQGSDVADALAEYISVWCRETIAAGCTHPASRLACHLPHPLPELPTAALKAG